MSLITIHIHAGLESDRLLREILERMNTMPTIQEVKDAVAAAVAAEREQVAAAVKKAVEEAIAKVPSVISEEDKNEIISAIDSIVPPPAAPGA